MTSDNWSLKDRDVEIWGHQTNLYYSYEDIETLRQKIISDICEELTFPESKIITDRINKRFGVK